jgi:hypothetical protein
MDKPMPHGNLEDSSCHAALSLLSSGARPLRFEKRKQTTCFRDISTSEMTAPEVHSSVAEAAKDRAGLAINAYSRCD